MMLLLMSQENNSESKLMHNLYDKTSVTQFVDSLLNNTNGNLKNRSSNLISSTATNSSCTNNNDEFASLASNTSMLTISNDNNTNTLMNSSGENIYQCLDEDVTIPYSVSSQLSDLISNVSSSLSSSAADDTLPPTTR